MLARDGPNRIGHEHFPFRLFGSHVARITAGGARLEKRGVILITSTHWQVIKIPHLIVIVHAGGGIDCRSI